MKKDAYYFPHFSNARNDSKVLKLRRILGAEGYAVYFMLLEILREQTDWRFPLSGIPELEFEMRVSKEKISNVIMDYELFEVDKTNNFFSPKLIHYLQPYIEKSQKARESAKIRWNNAKALPTHSERNASKGEESKVDETKANESKQQERIIAATKVATIEERRNEFMNKVAAHIPQYGKEMLREFFDYWVEMNEGGKKMRFEMQKVFDISRRLKTWDKNNKFKGNGTGTKKGFDLDGAKNSIADYIAKNK